MPHARAETSISILTQVHSILQLLLGVPQVNVSLGVPLSTAPDAKVSSSTSRLRAGACCKGRRVVCVGGTIKPPGPTLLPWTGHLSLAWITQSPIQVSFEHFQCWGTHSFSEQPVLASLHPHHEKFLPYLQMVKANPPNSRHQSQAPNTDFFPLVFLFLSTEQTESPEQLERSLMMGTWGTRKTWSRSVATHGSVPTKIWGQVCPPAPPSHTPWHGPAQGPRGMASPALPLASQPQGNVPGGNKPVEGIN